MKVVPDAVIAASDGRNFYPSFDPRTRYSITSVPQTAMDNRTQEVFIGRCLGGSSAINGMIFVRGTESEYDGWVSSRVSNHGIIWAKRLRSYPTRRYPWLSMPLIVRKVCC